MCSTFQADDRLSFGQMNFGNPQLGDRRRTRRLVRSADAILRHPGGSLPQKLRSSAELEALYHLMKRPTVTHQSVLAPHCERTKIRLHAVVGWTARVGCGFRELHRCRPTNRLWRSAIAVPTRLSFWNRLFTAAGGSWFALRTIAAFCWDMVRMRLAVCCMLLPGRCSLWANTRCGFHRNGWSRNQSEKVKRRSFNTGAARRFFALRPLRFCCVFLPRKRANTVTSRCRSGLCGYVPWFNAPPGTAQEMGLFLLLSDGSGDQALQDVARLTRNDRFAPLPGHVVFSSHFHVEHTRELLNAQKNPDETGTQTGRLPSGREYRIPQRLKNPGFVRKLRDHGVDIVHLAEFHSGKTPRMAMPQRVKHLELLHAECQRLSKEGFLLLPGEEPNVHLGGHWISFFPKPAYWVLNRPKGTPFVTEHPRLGRVYHVGGEADILRLLRAENGLAWTAHPRIKSSTGFPDRYRHRLFFESDHFLGAAWKAMPADLSQPRLGSRVLDLLDDMSNWGTPKFALGEVDVFKIEPDHELYGHMNVNYLRLEKVPRFKRRLATRAGRSAGRAVFCHNGRGVDFWIHRERAKVR